MKRIEKNEMKTMRTVLSKLPYKPLAIGNYALVFPIDDTNETKDLDGIELTVKKTSGGHTPTSSPVILMNSSTSDPVVLAYADLAYSREFDMLQYCDLLGIQLSKSDKNILETIEARLVSRDAILVSYRF